MVDCNQLIYLIPEKRELALILSHDIACAHLLIAVKIVGHGGKLPVGSLGYLLHREIEEWAVVRLELKDASVRKERLVDRKKLMGGKTPLECLAFGHGSEKFR